MYEQREDETGYIFYINKKTGERQNDNPKLLDVMNVIREQHKYIKYVTYRCATKIWLLKQSFYTINIPYEFVISVLSHHGLNQNDNAPALKPMQLTGLLHDIYFAAEKCRHFSQCDDFNLERCTAMLSNFFWCIFDPNRMVPISLLEFKQLMLILCNTQHFDQFILEEFAIACDHNRCVNRFKFESVIKVISKIFSYLDENTNYGYHMVVDWVHECFEQCPGIIGLNEFQFTCLWQNQSIHFVHYSNVLALLHRIKESQNIVHEIQCVSCKVAPIIGIRFKCQQCRKVSLCFECFCKGFTNSKHEMHHRMYELSTIQTKTNRFCSIFEKIWTCLTSQKSVDQQNITNFTLETKIADEKNLTTGTATIECINDTKFHSIRKTRQLKDVEIEMSTKQNESVQLNEIIDLIMNEAEHLQNHVAKQQNGKIKKRKRSESEFLSEHHTFMLEIIDKLRDISAIKSDKAAVPHASTPYRPTQRTIAKRAANLNVDSRLITSIRGSAINKSYLENDKSDLSIGDISSWFCNKSQPNITVVSPKPIDKVASDPIDTSIDSDMQHFKELLSKIREIMDDSYSDNVELSSATRKLENVLDNIIGAEEQKRTYL